MNFAHLARSLEPLVAPPANVWWSCTPAGGSQPFCQWQPLLCHWENSRIVWSRQQSTCERGQFLEYYKNYFMILKCLWGWKFIFLYLKLRLKLGWNFLILSLLCKEYRSLGIDSSHNDSQRGFYWKQKVRLFKLFESFNFRS